MGNIKKSNINEYRRRQFFNVFNLLRVYYINIIDNNIRFFKVLNFEKQSLSIEGMTKALQLYS